MLSAELNALPVTIWRFADVSGTAPTAIEVECAVSIIARSAAPSRPFASATSVFGFAGSSLAIRRKPAVPAAFLARMPIRCVRKMPRHRRGAATGVFTASIISHSCAGANAGVRSCMLPPAASALQPVQLAQRCGARQVFATAGSESRQDLLRRLGGWPRDGLAVSGSSQNQVLGRNPRPRALTSFLNAVGRLRTPPASSPGTLLAAFLELGKRGIWTAEAVWSGEMSGYHRTILGALAQSDHAAAGANVEVIWQHWTKRIVAHGVLPVTMFRCTCVSCQNALRHASRANASAGIAMVRVATEAAPRRRSARRCRASAAATPTWITGDLGTPGTGNAGQADPRWRYVIGGGF